MDLTSFKEISYLNILKDTYYISEFGDVFSKKKNRLLKPNKDKDGYLMVGLLTTNNRRIHRRISTLVCYMYNGEPPPEIQDITVDHIDGDILNNHYSNLHWIQRGLNSSIRHKKPKGENNGRAKLTEKDVLQICDLLVNTKFTMNEISDMYNVSNSSIQAIKYKKEWVYLTQDYNFHLRKFNKNK